MKKKRIYFLYGLALFPFLGILTETLIKTNVQYVWGILSLVLALSIIISEKGKVKVPLYLRFFFFFLLYTMIRNYIFSDLFSFVGLFKNKYLLFFSFSFLIENTHFNRKFIINYKKMLWIVLIFAFITTFIQIFNKSFMINFSSEHYAKFASGELGRYPSVFSWVGGRYYLNMTTLSIGAIFFSHYYKQKNFISLYFTLFMVAFIVFLGQMRWGMVGFLILLQLYFLYTSKKNKLHSTFKTITITIIFIVTLIQILPFFEVPADKIINERILQTGKSFEENTAYTRLFAFKTFAKFFPDNPIFGRGSTLDDRVMGFIAGRSSQIHVGYLQLFYFFGIVGGILYLLFLYNLLKINYRLAKKIEDWTSFIIILIFAWSLLTLVNLGPVDAGFFSAIIIRKYNNDWLTKKNNKVYDYVQ